MNVIQEINRINKLELQNGSVNTSASWHAKYSNSAWVYVGNLPIQLSDGDVISVMSQFGEIEDFNLVRDESTGKSKGFAFVKYEDARSCVLAVDNFNGSMVLGRSMRVDHVENYRLPKHVREREEELMNASSQSGVLEAGHAYKGKELLNSYDISQGQDLFAPVQSEQKEHGMLLGGDEDIDDHRRREEKEARKRERENKRREKEVRREQREERRRLKRAKKLMKEEKRSKREKPTDDKEGINRKRHDSDESDSSRSHSAKLEKGRKQKHRKRHDSDDSNSSTDKESKKRRRHDSDDSDQSHG